MLANKRKNVNFKSCNVVLRRNKMGQRSAFRNKMGLPRAFHLCQENLNQKMKTDQWWDSQHLGQEDLEQRAGGVYLLQFEGCCYLKAETRVAEAVTLHPSNANGKEWKLSDTDPENGRSKQRGNQRGRSREAPLGWARVMGDRACWATGFQVKQRGKSRHLCAVKRSSRQMARFQWFKGRW